MKSLRFRNTIFDRDAFDAALRTLEHATGPSESDRLTARTQVLKLAQSTLKAGKDEIRRRLTQGANGRVGVKGTTWLIDGLVIALFHHIERTCNPEGVCEAASQMTLVATGGYGRAELNPMSDIDLLFLVPEAITPTIEQVVQGLLYLLWDLKLKVGHAVRTIPECLVAAQEEIQTFTALLETRYLTGPQPLYDRFFATFSETIHPDDFAFPQAKIEERIDRFRRFDKALYINEPNIKEGPGGLRDIHTVWWISKYIHRVPLVKFLIGRGVFSEEEYRTFIESRDFLWQVRSALHFVTGRAEDRLSLQVQPLVAELLGFKNSPRQSAVSRLMRRYFFHITRIHHLTDVFIEYFEQQAHPDTTNRVLDNLFCVVGQRVNLRQPALCPIEEPLWIMQAFRWMQIEMLPLHADLHRQIIAALPFVDRRVQLDPGNNRLFLEILKGERWVARTLQAMNRARFLGRFIPEFARIVCLTQHDGYHAFTVDEHTILAVEQLRHIRMGQLTQELPYSSRIMAALERPEILYLAVLFHDIAKGRGGDHSIKGAAIARKVCQRMGLDKEGRETVAWLVRNHLLMAHTAQRRDIDDPQTVVELAQQVEHPQRLSLLLLVTVADIRAVSPKAWTSWKAQLLRNLYDFTNEALNRGVADLLDTEKRAEDKRRLVADAAVQRGFLRSQVNHYLKRFTAPYMLHYTASRIVEHMSFLLGRLEKEITVHFVQRDREEVTELWCYSADFAGLLAKLCQVLASHDISIIQAHVHTLKTGHAFNSIDVVDAATGGPIVRLKRLDKVRRDLEAALTGKEVKLPTPTQGIKKGQGSPFKVRQHITLDFETSEEHTLCEVQTHDFPGLLYTITHVISGLGLQITTAKIATYGARAIDVFYLQEAQSGLPIQSTALQEQLVTELNQALLAAAEIAGVGEAIIQASEEEEYPQ